MPRIIVAKTGGTIQDDEKSLSLDTNSTSLMIYQEETKTDGSTSHTHNLGYYPLVFAFFHDGSGNWHPQNSISAGFSDITQDTNTIYINNDFGQETKLFICGNAVDNSEGTGKNTAIGMLKVWKPDISIENETDIRKFQFCSGLGLFNKNDALSGSITFTTDSGTSWEEEKTVAHGLDFIPFVTAIDDSGTLGLGGELPLEYLEINNLYYYVNATNIVFGVSISLKDPEVQTFTFRYNVYMNKIA